MAEFSLLDAMTQIDPNPSLANGRFAVPKLATRSNRLLDAHLYP